MVRSVLNLTAAFQQSNIRSRDFEVGGASHKQLSSVLQYGTGRKPKEIIMTQLQNPQGQDPFTQSVQAEVYDPVTGHIDAVATLEAQRFIFDNSNIVRTANGSVDHSATLNKRIAAKRTYLATRP